MSKSSAAESPPSTPDRRASRTRSALRDALIELICERDWDEIAVQDICERADVARSTFYLHYTGKDALLESGFEDLRAGLRTHARAGAASRTEWQGFSFVPGLVLHVQENQRVFRSLVGRRSGQAIHQRFREMLVRLIAEGLPAGDGALPAQARARCVAALLTELLGWWVDNGAIDADALTVRFDRIAKALLTAR